MIDFFNFSSVKRELKGVARKGHADVLRWYAPGVTKAIGVRNPEMRVVSRQLIEFNKTNPKALALLVKIWNTEIFEFRWIAQDAIRGLEMKEAIEFIEKTKSGVNNWMHSDNLLCAIGKHSKENPEVIMKLAERYSKSKQPWTRRLGVIFPIHVVKKYPRYLDRTLKILDRNMKDDHDYVRKGVSWTCANCYLINIGKTRRWLKNWEGKRGVEKTVNACYSRIRAYEKRRE